MNAVDNASCAGEVVEEEASEESNTATDNASCNGAIAAALLCAFGGLEANVLTLVEADWLAESESSC